MLRFASKLLLPAVCGAAALWTSPTSACNVPVFRYALERWPADPYEIVVFHSGTLTEAQQAALATLEKASQGRLANLAVTNLNLEADMPQQLRMLWNDQRNPSPPWMVVSYPRTTGIERSAWAGLVSAEAVGSLLESPARREIVRKLMSGDAVVWLLLGSGDSKGDDRVAQLVEAELRKLEQSLVLPERSPMDPPINPDLPLKIAFSTLRVARTDPAESMLVNMLLNWKPNLASETEVMLFPIFGRGRVVSPAVGNQITAEAIRDMAEFLTGPCSCEVKSLNPGYDLLLAAHWDSLPGDSEAVPPPLVGMSQFAAAAGTNLAAPPSLPAVSFANAGTAPAASGRGRLVRNLVVVLGIGVVFLGAISVVLRVKSGRGAR